MGIMQKQFADLITFTRASAGGYRNWQGVHTMAAANERRIDHDPASVSLSTATVTLGAGQHTFTTTRAYRIDEWLRASADANNWMVGRVVAAGEGSVTIEVAAARVRGSGTYSSWTLIVCLGLLIEEKRTNLLLRSSEFDAANWSSAAVSVAGNVATGPDGTLTADKLIPNTINTNHYTSQVGALADNTTATFSIFAKVAGYSQVRVNIRDKAGAFRSFIVSLVDGGIVVAPPPTLTVSVSGVSDGWFRVSCTLNFGSGATTPAVYVYPAANGTDFFAGDGTSGIYIWGAQLEVGAFPTSYIPTTTAQVTRAADVASVNELSPWFNASEGTLYFKGNSRFFSGAGQTSVWLNQGGYSGVRLYRQSSTKLGMVLNTLDGNAPITLNVDSNLGEFAHAATYSSNGISTSANGGTPTVVQAHRTGFAPTSLRIGSYNPGNYFNGHIESIRYFPRALSNTELQRITA
ncbi:phage head spike fiber domain-containing protein [Stutzerimonas stutzeri]